MKRLIVAGVALLLTVAACGDDGGDAGDSELTSDLAAQILADTDSDSVPLTDENAVCFAGALIDEFGGDRMVDALDMEFEDFMAAASPQERRTVIDVMLDCVDFGGLLTAEFSSDISQESAQCLSNAFVGNEAFRNALANSFASDASDPFDDETVMAELIPAMFECLSAEELLQLGDE